MNPTNANPAAAKIINLYDDEDKTANRQADHNTASPSALDAMIANPRFSTPANDEQGLSNSEPLAPHNTDCRQAKLLCMWVDILVEGEIA